MPHLPTMLNIAGRRCVIVGGGSVAARRGQTLLDSGADLTIIAPSMDEATAALSARLERRPYKSQDLQNVLLVVIATDDDGVNQQVARDAKAAGVLTNRADRPDLGDVIIPAHAHHGPVTIAVDTSGASPAAAAKIRRELSASLDETWPKLLEIIMPYRSRVQELITDNNTRRDVLRALTDENMVALLNDAGADAVKAACKDLIEGATAATPADGN